MKTKKITRIGLGLLLAILVSMTFPAALSAAVEIASERDVEIVVRSSYYPAAYYARGLNRHLEGNRFALYYNDERIDEQISNNLGMAIFPWTGPIDNLFVQLISPADGFISESYRVPVREFGFGERFSRFSYFWFFYCVDNPQTPSLDIMPAGIITLAPTTQTQTLTVHIGPPVRAYVNEEYIPGSFIYDGRTLSQVRPLVYAFGGDIDWDGDTRQVYVQVDSSTRAIFTIDSFIVTTERTIGNDILISQEEMSVTPRIWDGRTYLPGRYVAYLFGAEVIAI